MYVEVAEVKLGAKVEVKAEAGVEAVETGAIEEWITKVIKDIAQQSLHSHCIL